MALGGRRHARIPAAALAVVLSTCVLAPSALAKAELTVSPLLMEVSARAGETVTETITVAATGDEAIVVELVHADFGFDDNYGVVLIEDDAPETTAFSTRDWFSMPKETYRIPAGQSRDLPLRIDVPENTPGGTYLGAAFLQLKPPDPTGGGSQVQAVPRTGPLVFIAVEGGDPPKAAMRRFELPTLVTTGPLRPDLVIENVGDEFFTFEGTVRLAKPGKDDVVDIRRQFVVPGEPRKVRTSADDKSRIVLGSSKLGIGRYEVTARLRIEPVGTSLVATRTVWVIPTWARVVGVLAALALLVSIGLLVRWFARRREFDELVRDEVAATSADDDLVDDDLVDDDVADDDDLEAESYADDLDDDDLDDEDLVEDDLDDDSGELR